MPEAANLSGPVLAAAITHNDLGNLQIQFGSTEKQVKIAKRVKVAKVTAVVPDLFIILFKQHLGSAQGILDALIQYMGKEKAEKLFY